MSQFATLICVFFILYLFWIDRRKSEDLSNAIWIPFFWMFLAGSRYVSAWLNLSEPMRSVDAYAEGSPTDRVVFFLLFASGVIVLLRRKVDWGRLLADNKWIWLYFLYCGISVVWSDYPFLSFKRWIKELGNPIMVLLILTEKRPYEALGIILRRLAFVLLPLSVLFIRYYPDMGRAYSYHTGKPMFTGVTDQKNTLGLLCLMSGIYFSWKSLLVRKGGSGLGGKDMIIDVILMAMTAWLLRMSESATSQACLAVAVTLFFMSRMELMVKNPGRIIVLLITVVPVLLFLDAILDMRGVIISLLGRSPDLTTRIPVWQGLEKMATNSAVGTGFMSFWTGERMQEVWEKYGGISQAHNGYLEQYLNLGYVGVGFIGAIILSGLLKVRKHLYLDYPSAMLRLCFIVTALLYNYTEASFYGVNNMWLLLLLATIEIPAQRVPFSNG